MKRWSLQLPLHSPAFDFQMKTASCAHKCSGVCPCDCSPTGDRVCRDLGYLGVGEAHPNYVRVCKVRRRKFERCELCHRGKWKRNNTTKKQKKGNLSASLLWLAWSFGNWDVEQPRAIFPGLDQGFWLLTGGIWQPQNWQRSLRRNSWESVSCCCANQKTEQMEAGVIWSELWDSLPFFISAWYRFQLLVHNDS